MVKFLVVFYTFIFVSLPLVLSSIPFILSENKITQILSIALFPFIFCITFMITTGVLSVPFHKGIISGRFPRELSHAIYGKRRLYGLCWTTIYYSGPLYFFILTFRPLKQLLLKLFGYKGSIDFVVYPDTWIRDWPLLNFGKGSYISNKSSLGSNLCLSNGQILVEGITFGNGALIGHLGMLGPGVHLGDSAELGSGVAAGIRVRVGAKSKVGSCSIINHGAVIGENVEIGAHSFLGLKSSIASDLKIPSGANIPAGAEIRKQEDVDRFYSSETRMLNELRESLSAGLTANFGTGLRVAGIADDSKTGIP